MQKPNNYRGALIDLSLLGITTSRLNPTTSDVPLSIKIKGGPVREDFDPFTPLACGNVIDIANMWNPSELNPTMRIKGKLFLQLTMRIEDQKRLFRSYPQRNYLPVKADSDKILRFVGRLGIISLGMHDYNADNTHIWPGIPHSYLYAPSGTPYDPNHPPVIHGDGFPYIQRGHLTLARREIPMSNVQYSRLLEGIEKLRESAEVSVLYDMGESKSERVFFNEVWLKINPYNKEPTRILYKVTLSHKRFFCPDSTINQITNLTL